MAFVRLEILMKKVLFTFFIFIFFSTVSLFVFFKQAIAACGQLYDNRITGCYIVPPGANDPITSSGYDCPFAHQCYAFEEVNKTCGIDTYNGRITYCSINNVFWDQQDAAPYKCPHVGNYCLQGDPIGSPECNFVSGSDQSRNIGFCFGGFSSEEALRSSKLSFQCVGTGLCALPNPQISSLDTTPVGDSQTGKYSCVYADIATEFINVIDRKRDLLSTACGVAGVGEIIATFGSVSAFSSAISTGASTTALSTQFALLNATNRMYWLGSAVAGGAQTIRALTVPITASIVTAGCLKAVNDVLGNLTIRFQVIKPDNTIHCTRELNIRVSNPLTSDAEAGVNSGTNYGREPSLIPTDICEFAREKSQICTQCIENDNGVWTALGCIPANPQDFVKALIRISVGIAGGIAFLMMTYGGFILMMSRGNPEELNHGKEIFFSAIAGLFLIIFSVVILKIIGIDILGIPGL